MHSAADKERGYPVEVSGWDLDENFFVEKTVLEWQESGVKTIHLHSAIRVGCVLFIRLLQSAPIGNNFPVPYEAASVAEADEDCTVQVALVQLQPRISSRAEKYREGSPVTTMS